MARGRWVGLGGGDADGSTVRKAFFLFFEGALTAQNEPPSSKKSDGGLTGPPSIRALVATCRRLDSRARAPAGTNEQPWCVRYSGTACIGRDMCSARRCVSGRREQGGPETEFGNGTLCALYTQHIHKGTSFPGTPGFTAVIFSLRTPYVRTRS